MASKKSDWLLDGCEEMFSRLNFECTREAHPKDDISDDPDYIPPKTMCSWLLNTPSGFKFSVDVTKYRNNIAPRAKCLEMPDRFYELTKAFHENSDRPPDMAASWIVESHMNTLIIVIGYAIANQKGPAQCCGLDELMSKIWNENHPSIPQNDKYDIMYAWTAGNLLTHTLHALSIPLFSKDLEVTSPYVLYMFSSLLSCDLLTVGNNDSENNTKYGFLLQPLDEIDNQYETIETLMLLWAHYIANDTYDDIFSAKYPDSAVQVNKYAGQRAVKLELIAASREHDRWYEICERTGMFAALELIKNGVPLEDVIA